ncbi:DgyrCDS6823 [Dimorphilus gyrociliatus]|uniref:DgyrCDS6823 n=1 Tax=Dimorphilus gyrociliatus TaxID=2664684 RepID=A0A7I8VU09_9ANNE|nr:DgyrCDS6823 [Dimorphilus gyrociliatus]
MASIVLSPSPLNVALGGQNQLGMGFQGVTSCKVVGADPNLMEISPFIFTGFKSGFFRISLKPAASVGLLSAIHLLCMTIFNGEIKSNSIEVHGIDNSIMGDPHFFQVVFDSKKNSTESICYDVTGKSGQLIVIASKSDPGITVFGRLKDDYYMHEIIIAKLDKNLTISLKGIRFGDKEIEWLSSWTKELRVADFTYKMTNSRVDVNVVTKDFPTMSVTRGVHGISSMHLNVEFSTTDTIEGGLMGHVNRNNYQFFNSVQRFSAYGAVKVNSIMAPAWLKTMGHQSCWYMALKNLLAPSTIKDYIRD